jgi:putative restriction endonuclease
MTAGESERLLRLQQYRRDGARVPHKPLLVLLALRQLADTGSSDCSWFDTSGRLAGLIAEFGPSSRTSRLQRAAYPFTHLRSDGVWHLSADVPMDRVAPLEAGRVTGRLSRAIEDELRGDVAAIETLARRIVDAQWPPTVAPDVLAAVGFDPDVVVLPVGRPDRESRRRSAAWRAEVMTAWDGVCAFCGYDGSLAGAPVGVEAAHVRWFNIGGPDELDNGLALCSLHHKLFDRGALGLTTDHRLEVSSVFRAAAAGRAVYDLHGVRLAPRPGTLLPAERYVRWHRSQVFQGEPLSA